MLTIYCNDSERKKNCARDVCCIECSDKECQSRCKKKIIETCLDFEEDID